MIIWDYAFYLHSRCSSIRVKIDFEKRMTCLCVIARCVIFALCCSLQNVHHAGQPMPGEEQEDIVMTSTQMSILNVTCPLTGKPVIELVDPVRWYEYNFLLQPFEYS